MWDTLQWVTSAAFARSWATCAWICDVVLTVLIIWRVPFTNVDWEAYMEEVGGVLAGEFDYNKLAGPTGPVAYPAGFVWLYAVLRWLDLRVETVQALFGAFYLATVLTIFQIYRRAEAPGWLLPLCLLSKRVHSIYCLRLFNDGVAQALFFLALLLCLQQRRLGSALVYSLGVSIKMQPLLACPAVGLCLVLAGGWGEALTLVMVMLLLQVLLAAPFLLCNPWAYLARAFGGPGHLQHAWSVNWRALPAAIFEHPAFPAALLICHVVALGLFAHKRWIPGGWQSSRLWCWRRGSGPPLDAKAVICIWFACNFVGVVFMRTLHFQFLVWYFHTVPFLAWFAVKPDDHRGLSWALRCVLVVVLVLAVELPYLRTTTGVVQGPDGRSWETPGVPTAGGSLLLQVAHGALLILLAARRVHTEGEKKDK